ncbi:acyl-CoA carboxylase epsilon subunit [Streptomyces sp. H27-D2]|uniref:acyl-CoA carboxylase epsilon subunit n=1 Tax=Streptomyces sp. H27-D2 TaxID=3046304 RepID=UPI002DBDC44B|nr:acyl-CoA carboxylase epsilon subunit [Streptomyces sp. H27-D2]MEC4017083.1 acyl-CoA carboxylase epsilon subunit [Streptomyces sp. H27-D2]
MSTPAKKSLLRVEKGHAEPEELAALTAALLARAAAPRTRARRGRLRADWRRLVRIPRFRAPHSWQD